MSTQDAAQPQLSAFAVPDLKVVAEMQMGIVTRLADIKREKEEGKPVVWCSLLTPKEILYAMDVPASYGEILAGWASLFGLAGRYCQTAEEGGLSRDVCAIHRCAVGLACDNNRDAFFEGAFAAPDLVVASNFPCMSEAKSFLYVVDRYKCPSFFMDAPINTWGKDLPEHAVQAPLGCLQRFPDASGSVVAGRKGIRLACLSADGVSVNRVAVGSR